MKLNKTTLKGLKAPDPSGKPKLHFDDELKGFAVLCSGKTAVRSYIVQRDLPDGKTRRITIGNVAEIELDQARAEAADALHKLRQGIDPKAERKAQAGTDITLRTAFAAYLASRPNLRPKTLTYYKDSLSYIDAWLDRPLRTIDREAVEIRHREIAKEVIARNGTSGAGTANGAMRTLRAIWNFAVDRYELPGRNPVRLDRQQWFKEPRRESHVADTDLSRFYAGIQNLQNTVARDYLTLLLFTGLRRGEAARLTWDDIDLTARTITIPAGSTKAGRTLALPMSDIIHAMLVGRRSVGRTAFVFPSIGRTGYIAEPKFPLRLIAKATGIQISPHDLRRTYLTAAEAAGVHGYVLKALANHALPQGDVTGGYLQISVERLREPVQKIADRLKILCGIVPPAGENIMKFS
jgi:integrase